MKPIIKDGKVVFVGGAGAVAGKKEDAPSIVEGVYNAVKKIKLPKKVKKTTYSAHR